LGRACQFRLDSHSPKRSRSFKAIKLLMSKTLSLLPAIARKPPMLQKLTWKLESSFKTGRESPKGRLLGYKDDVDVEVKKWV